MDFWEKNSLGSPCWPRTCMAQGFWTQSPPASVCTRVQAYTVIPGFIGECSFRRWWYEGIFIHICCQTLTFVPATLSFLSAPTVGSSPYSDSLLPSRHTHISVFLSEPGFLTAGNMQYFVSPSPLFIDALSFRPLPSLFSPFTFLCKILKIVRLSIVFWLCFCVCHFLCSPHFSLRL